MKPAFLLKADRVYSYAAQVQPLSDKQVNQIDERTQDLLRDVLRTLYKEFPEVNFGMRWRD